MHRRNAHEPRETDDDSGDVRKGQGDAFWTYSPHDTWGDAPWDPYYPQGNDPDGDDKTAGGALFVGVFADDNGVRVKVNITLTDDHKGYQFYHRSGDPNRTHWVDKTFAGKGGLLLVGGGDHPLGAYNWFGDQATGGDIVVIANKKSAVELQTAVDELYAEFGSSAHAIDGFSFDVDPNDFLTANAQAVVDDITKAAQAGAGLGHEFIDKLQGAEGVYFCGGDQWPYVQVLEPGPTGDNLASATISGRNNAVQAVVGGTSAGLAILGNYVFTARWGGITSNEILTNYSIPSFGRGAAIVSDVLGIEKLTNVLTETHFTDPGKASVDDSGQEVYRLGRLLEFLGSIMYAQQPVKGLAVDDSTALTIDKDGNAQVYGQKSVYFAKADPGGCPISDEWPDPDTEYLNVGDVDLSRYSQWDEPFSLATAWNYSAGRTDVVATSDGNVLWLQGEPFF